jgi:hypothetical protein
MTGNHSSWKRFLPFLFPQNRRDACQTVAFALVVLWVAGLAGELYHNLVVPHHWCEVHGEWTHSDDESVVSVHSQSAGLNENNVTLSEHEHADCSLSVTRRRFQIAPISIVVAVDLDLARSFSPSDFSPSFVSAFPIYQLAPKNSPPRV